MSSKLLKFMGCIFIFIFAGETFARLVDNYMRPAIHKGVPPLFNNIRNLYADKEKVILLVLFILSRKLELNNPFLKLVIVCSFSHHRKELPGSFLLNGHTPGIHLQA